MWQYFEYLFVYIPYIHLADIKAVILNECGTKIHLSIGWFNCVLKCFGNL